MGDRQLGAQRIGQGCVGSEDPVLLQYLADKRIMLELCLSSNLWFGLVKSLSEHPIRRFLELGIPISLNIKNPAPLEHEHEQGVQASCIGFGAYISRSAANLIRLPQVLICICGRSDQIALPTDR